MRLAGWIGSRSRISFRYAYWARPLILAECTRLIKDGLRLGAGNLSFRCSPRPRLGARGDRPGMAGSSRREVWVGRFEAVIDRGFAAHIGRDPKVSLWPAA